MLNYDQKFSYGDIGIVPCVTSDIDSRSEVFPFRNVEGSEVLPIFTAPMSTVVCPKNFDKFKEHRITPIMPRNESFDLRMSYMERGEWVALSLNEFIGTFVHDTFVPTNTPHVLIDIANGHMDKLYEAVKTAKSKLDGNIIIMVGNIANPWTYKTVWECGADYVRVGIGAGSGCITSSNTGIHYPMVSLLDDISSIKKHIRENESLASRPLPKIVADGGIRNYDDVIKAIAMGADFVMIGGLFASLIESASRAFVIDDEGNETYLDTELLNEEYGSFRYGELVFDKVYKSFYGMASRLGQIDLMGSKTKTSEGCVKNIEVSTSLEKWCENMESYLRSAMSYTGSKTLDDFNWANVSCIVLSPIAKSAFNA